MERVMILQGLGRLGMAPIVCNDEEGFVVAPQDYVPKNPSDYPPVPQRYHPWVFGDALRVTSAPAIMTAPRPVITTASRPVIMTAAAAPAGTTSSKFVATTTPVVVNPPTQHEIDMRAQATAARHVAEDYAGQLEAAQAELARMQDELSRERNARESARIAGEIRALQAEADSMALDATDAVNEARALAAQADTVAGDTGRADVAASGVQEIEVKVDIPKWAIYAGAGLGAAVLLYAVLK